VALASSDALAMGWASRPAFLSSSPLMYRIWVHRPLLVQRGTNAESSEFQRFFLRKKPLKKKNNLLCASGL
jgi:hypothetical protein